MKRSWLALVSLSLVLLLAPAEVPLAVAAQTTRTYLPQLVKPGTSGCPGSSGNSYQAGPAYQRDTDNPVRPAYNHADKNLSLRGYSPTNASKGFVNHGSTDPTQPPQLATLFNPNRVSTFSSTHRANNWNWQPSPNPGSAGSAITDWPVTVLGMQTTGGEGLYVPTSGYDLGGGMEVLVLFADADTIVFKYTRDDSAAPNGYAVHVDNICTDPNLLALYNSLDSGARYVYQGYPYAYNLPNLPAGRQFGTARGTEIRVAVVDSGAFMDPRSCGDWWLIRPGRSC